jgi:hypothetical protein
LYREEPVFVDTNWISIISTPARKRTKPPSDEKKRVPCIDRHGLDMHPEPTTIK